MAPLNPTAALPAPADVDVELPVDGLARDLDLVLLGDVGLVQWAAACRRGSPRRVGGGGARSRPEGRGGVVEGLGSRRTRRVAYPIIGEAQATVRSPGPGAGISLSRTR